MVAFPLNYIKMYIINVMELRSKECIDAVLQSLTDHVTIKINGSLKSEDIFHTVVNMAVNRSSVHSVSKQYQNVACDTSLLHHLKKLGIEELVQSNEKKIHSKAHKNPKNR